MTDVETYCKFDCKIKDVRIDIIFETGKHPCDICPLKEYLKEQKQKIK